MDASCKSSFRATCRAARSAVDERCVRLGLSSSHALLPKAVPRLQALRALSVKVDATWAQDADAGAVARALALPAAAPLASLQLYIAHETADPDVSAIARRLGALAALANVDLHSHVSRRGGCALVKALAVLPRLKRLQLDLIVKHPSHQEGSYSSGFYDIPFLTRQLQDWYEEPPLITFKWPLLEELCLKRGALALLPQLAGVQLPSLQRLEITDTLHADALAGGDALSSVWAAGWVARLQRLAFNLPAGYCIKPDTFAPLLQHGASAVAVAAAGPAMPTAPAILACLRELLIGAVVVGADGARALAAASLPALRKLALADVEDAGLEALAAAPWLRGLEDFAAEVRPALSAAAAAALAASHLTSLTRLALSSVAPLEDASSEAAAALVSAPGTFAGLHELVLQNVELGSISSFPNAGKPLEVLACMPMQHLTRLEVSGTCLGAHDIAFVLPRAPWIGRLVELRIANEDLGGVQAFEAFADLPLGGLRRIDICNCRLAPDSLAALNEAVWLDGLQMLNLSDKFDSHEEVLLMDRVLQVDGDPLVQLKGSQRLTACWSTSEHDDYMDGFEDGDEDCGKDIYDPAGAWQW